MGANLVTIVRNFQIETEPFDSDRHDVEDRRVTPGTHKLLRFDFLSHNAGEEDLVVGRRPSPARRFAWNPAGPGSGSCVNPAGHDGRPLGGGS